jgi:hypothetical protein
MKESDDVKPTNSGGNGHLVGTSQYTNSNFNSHVYFVAICYSLTAIDE